MFVELLLTLTLQTSPQTVHAPVTLAMDASSGPLSTPDGSTATVIGVAVGVVRTNDTGTPLESVPNPDHVIYMGIPATTLVDGKPTWTVAIEATAASRLVRDNDS